MFYRSPNRETPSGKTVSALVCLTPSESKRLIGKAVAAIPEVTDALKNGTVIISRGTTNAFVVEEIVGVKVEPKSSYTLGCITGGELSVNESEGRWRPFVLRQGKQMDMLPSEALKDFTAQDVFIKGANAVDPQGNAGILVGGAQAGTVGEAWHVVTARGSHFVVPVGLEKLVPSVTDAAQQCGSLRFKYSMGLPSGLFPLVNALVVTEVQALEILAGVSAAHVASGGIGGSEGSVVLSVTGDEERLEKAFELVKSVKGEPPLTAPPKVTPSAAGYNYDPMALWLRQNAPRPRR
ncbi:MAG: hypothetical protein HY671_10625 [Chloroflexi bacterium]|nr:hypothetical protein [Chloroflexota bacterium]